MHISVKLVLLLVTLNQPACAYTSSARLKKDDVRSYTREEMKRFVLKQGVSDVAKSIVHIPGHDGLRVILRSGRGYDVQCNGRIREVKLPAAMVYFDARGEAFAWYNGNKLQFRPGFVAPDVGNIIRVDPRGRYFASAMVRTWKGFTAIYRTDDPKTPAGMTSLAGYDLRLFSSVDKVIAVGSELGSDDVRMVLFQASDRTLREVETINIPQPKKWFPGHLVAEDATDDLSRVIFVYERDPPMGSSLYLYDVRSRKLSRLGRLKEFNVFCSCDPIRANLGGSKMK